MNNFSSPMKMLAAIIGAVAAVAVLVLSPMLMENLDASHVMVIQHVMGDISCHKDPGPKWQGFGTVTTFPRQGTYSFDTHNDKANTGKPLQFNDGGTATLYGQVNWQMPLDCAQIIEIKKYFGSSEGIESKGVSRMVNTAISLSGMTMTSMESFAERKAELVEVINDQAQSGAYLMETKSVERMNPITGVKESGTVAEIVRDKNGKAKRQHGSILEQYGVTLQPMSIEKLVYSDVVNAQIKSRQDSLTQVKVSQAQAEKAIQAAITAEKDGMAAAATARWKQETIKAQLVTEAEQRRDISALDATAAANYKRQQILIGEGDAERKRLVLAADGALDQKLRAYVEVQTVWANKFGEFKGNLVPQISMGGTGAGGNAVGNTSSLIEMLSAKTARDLALDLTNSQGATAKK